MGYPAATARAFQYGLIVFTLTALLGLANATQLFGALDRNTLLTHLHSGTLGWITMGVIGITIWIFGASGSTLARNVMLSAVATAAYVLAFWSGNFQARAIFGTIELVVILYWWWFAVSHAMAEGFGRIDIPKLSIVLGLTTLVIGSTLGVLVQIILGTGGTLPTTPNLIGGHASAQVAGYLVLVAAGFAEWRLTGGGKRTTAGLVQVVLLFVAGLLLAIGTLTDNQQLPGLATLLQLVGTGFVVVRLGRAAIGAGWTEPSGARHIAISLAFLVVGVVILAVLIQQVVAAQGDFTRVSPGLITALDHSLFVGLMTNILFGAILGATVSAQRSWPWADNVVFWGLNIGAAAFIAVLIVAGSGEGAKPFTHPVAFVAPIMGLAALLGIATFSMRLMSAPAAMRAPAAA